jgi:16S rRNA (guanine1516-N2)-methyltransferase
MDKPKIDPETHGWQSTPVIAESNECVEQARQTANTWRLTYQSQAAEGLALFQTTKRLELRVLDGSKTGAVFVDFASDAMAYRRSHGGGLKKEAIAKAIGVKGNSAPSVVDATAGLGRDGFILASLGCQVTLLERSPIVAALLADGLKRAYADTALGEWLPQRLFLRYGVSSHLMQHWEGEAPDVIYLDPMFPHRKKSAQVKKEMRLFQQLLGVDEDADLLLEPALSLAKKRVVVKRPADAPFLADKKPNMDISSKKHRFDVYLR